MSTKDVANFIASTSFNQLSSGVIAKAKVAIRDSLGVSLAAHNDRAVEAVRKVAIAMGGREESTLMGIGTKVPCNMAAWVNAVMGSTLDMDDGIFGPEGHRCHPGAMVVPSSLALAERQNSTGKSLIEAVVVGYEVAIRNGAMMAEGKGGIQAGIGGNYGAAAAAAKLLGLTPEKIVNALGIAEAHRPYPTPAAIFRDKNSSPQEFMKHTPMTKENYGWAAMTGVTAALLAQAGFSAGRTIFDLPMYNQKILGTLGKEWEILNIYFKPYSTCRALHASIGGVLELIKKHNLPPDDISKITTGVSSIRAEMSNYRPSTRWEAQYSIPFAIGAALVDGEVGPKQIAEEKLDNKEILTQADKVLVFIDPEVEALMPGIDASSVEIETRGGAKFKTFQRYPWGEPQNPLSEEDLKEKFRKLATGALGVEKTEELIKCVSRLEDLSSINELLEKVAHCG